MEEGTKEVTIEELKILANVTGVLEDGLFIQGIFAEKSESATGVGCIAVTYGGENCKYYN